MVDIEDISDIDTVSSEEDVGPVGNGDNSFISPMDDL